MTRNARILHTIISTQNTWNHSLSLSLATVVQMIGKSSKYWAPIKCDLTMLKDAFRGIIADKFPWNLLFDSALHTLYYDVILRSKALRSNEIH